MNVMTLEEAKMVIDSLVKKDTSKSCESEKRAKVLNKILEGYIIQSRDGSYNTKKLYSLDEIGYLLGTTMQYAKLIEKKAVAKIQKGMNVDEDSACDFVALFS